MINVWSKLCFVAAVRKPDFAVVLLLSELRLAHEDYGGEIEDGRTENLEMGPDDAPRFRHKPSRRIAICGASVIERAMHATSRWTDA